jgi:hypothetical protein
MVGYARGKKLAGFMPAGTPNANRQVRLVAPAAQIRF